MAVDNYKSGELRAIIRSLHAGWIDSLANGDHRYGNVPARTAGVLALAMHAHRLASAFLVLREGNLVLEAVPVVRSAYEAALTGLWLAQIDEAIEVLILDGMKKRESIAREMAATPWAGAAEAAERVKEMDDQTPYLAVEKEPRTFRAICYDLQPGGAEAYSIYRYLSSFTHAGAFTIDEYLIGNVHDDAAPARLLRSPKMDDPFMLEWIVAACLVWAGRAADFQDVRRSRRSALRQVARTLKIPELLKPSTEQWLRAQRRRTTSR